jgi:hypothetical protein
VLRRCDGQAQAAPLRVLAARSQRPEHSTNPHKSDAYLYEHGAGSAADPGKVVRGESAFRFSHLLLRPARPAALSRSCRPGCRAPRQFGPENFEFGADVSAVAITAAASGQLGTTGASAGASGARRTQTTAGKYYKGLAVFTIAKGGAMVQAAVAGQKFTYKPKAAS